MMQYPLRNQLFNSYLFQAFLFGYARYAQPIQGACGILERHRNGRDGIGVNIITLSPAFMSINLRHLSVDAFWEIAR
jgi:hypothetical protein